VGRFSYRSGIERKDTLLVFLMFRFSGGLREVGSGGVEGSVLMGALVGLGTLDPLLSPGPVTFYRRPPVFRLNFRFYFIHALAERVVENIRKLLNILLVLFLKLALLMLLPISLACFNTIPLLSPRHPVHINDIVLLDMT
jgi:hypothetical protein